MPPAIMANTSALIGRRGSLTDLKTLNVAYEPSRSDESAREVIFALHPEWRTSEGEVEFVRFKEGITNNVSTRNPILLLAPHLVLKRLTRQYSFSKP